MRLCEVINTNKFIYKCPNFRLHLATQIQTMSYTVLTLCRNSCSNRVWCVCIQLRSSCAVNLKSRRCRGCSEEHQASPSVLLFCASMPSVNTAVAEGEWQTFQAKKIFRISRCLRPFICHYSANYSLIRTLGEKKILNSVGCLSPHLINARMRYFCLSIYFMILRD